MIKSISHIGIAVKDLDNSIEVFRRIFNYSSARKEIVEDQKVEIASFKVGDISIELTAPLDEESPIAKFLLKRGEGIHHIAFETDDVKEELSALDDRGIGLINKEAVPGASDMLIAFLHPRSTNGVLMELCEKQK